MTQDKSQSELAQEYESISTTKQQIVEYVSVNPDATNTEIADDVGVSDSYVSQTRNNHADLIDWYSSSSDDEMTLASQVASLEERVEELTAIVETVADNQERLISGDVSARGMDYPSSMGHNMAFDPEDDVLDWSSVHKHVDGRMALVEGFIRYITQSGVSVFNRTDFESSVIDEPFAPEERTRNNYIRTIVNKELAYYHPSVNPTILSDSQVSEWVCDELDISRHKLSARDSSPQYPDNLVDYLDLGNLDPEMVEDVSEFAGTEPSYGFVDPSSTHHEESPSRVRAINDKVTTDEELREVWLTDYLDDIEVSILCAYQDHLDTPDVARADSAISRRIFRRFQVFEQVAEYAESVGVLSDKNSRVTELHTKVDELKSEYEGASDEEVMNEVRNVTRGEIID